MRKGLVLAMEEEAGEVIADGSETAELQAQVETGTAESQAEADTVEQLITSVEEAEVDVEALGDIQEVIAGTVESGEGINPETAEIARIGVEAICARLGIRGRQVIPSLESFGSSNSRLAASRIAMEGIWDQIKTVWEAIKKAFISAWEKISDWFNSFFTNTDAVKKLANSIKTEANALTGEAKNKEFEGGSIAKMFNIDKKADKNTVQKILGNQESISQNYLNSVNTMENALKGIGGMLAGNDSARENVRKIFGEIINNMKHNVSDGNKVGPFIGGRFIEFKFDDANADALGVSVSMTDAEELTSKKVETLSKSDINMIADKVIGLMNKTEEYKKSKEKLNKLNKDLVAATDAAIKVLTTIGENKSEADSGKMSGIMKEAKTAVLDLQKIVGRFTMMLPSMNVQAGKAALKYASMSIKAHGKKEEEKKAA